ncbi:hypothetical protein PO002_44620 [Cupriavidus necator]|uniref:hypothetical protein n=1 Tax=Cupriavidus necator TaxID=106590 RepID=UPI0039C29B47
MLKFYDYYLRGRDRDTIRAALLVGQHRCRGTGRRWEAAPRAGRGVSITSHAEISVNGGLLVLLKVFQQMHYSWLLLGREKYITQIWYEIPCMYILLLGLHVAQHSHWNPGLARVFFWPLQLKA